MRLNRDLVAQELVKIARLIHGVRFPPASRASYLPKDNDTLQKAYVPKDVDVEAYSWEDGGKFVGVAWTGKANKPDFYNIFRDKSGFERELEGLIQQRQRYNEYKKEKQEERKKFRHSLNVDDILYASWGYDQTNIDFYQVVATTDKSVQIREIAQKTVKEERGSDYVIPVPDRFVGSKMTKKVSTSNSVKVNSRMYAHLWDGKPKRQTAMGWGH